MNPIGDAGSSSSNFSKPVVVRVKRKASQAPVGGFWLEINKRPRKQPLLDFGKLSISDTHLENQKDEELKNQKVFVQHMETVTSSDATVQILQSFMPHADSSEFKKKVEERKCYYKQGNKQDQLLSRSKQKHEFLAEKARFQQIWKSRKEKKENTDEDLDEKFHLYDVVRVDNEECCDKKETTDTSLEESMILCNYLPLIREFLPSVAEEIQSDMQSYISQRGSADEYVYDMYTVQDEMDAAYEDSSDAYPLVQVNQDDDFYDGPNQSDYETDDSNAEDNPLNEYPDEISEDDEDEDEDDEDEDEESESGSSDNQLDKVRVKKDDLEDEGLLYEGEDEDDW